VLVVTKLNKSQWLGTWHIGSMATSNTWGHSFCKAFGKMGLTSVAQDNPSCLHTNPPWKTGRWERG